MRQYAVSALCNVCSDFHPIDALITLEKGPISRKSIAEGYEGGTLPPELAALKDKRIYCPKTGRHYAQKNESRIFLIPVDASAVELLSKRSYAQSTGDRMAVLLDKLGERLAFERRGTDLYRAFLHKVESLSGGKSGPALEDLQQIYEQENEHLKFLQQAIAGLGGDPTVQTPSADIAGVLSQGIFEIVSNPTTTIAETLQAILNIELVDNDGWQMLIELAAELGQTKLEEQCRRALEEEQEHLTKVRDWCRNSQAGEGGEAIRKSASLLFRRP
jgi:rubrerythrin